MSIFGSTTQPSQSAGIFGNLGATSATQPASGGLFGNTNALNNNAGQTGGGLFGNTAGGGGIFGSTNNNTTQNQGGGGLFGSTNTQTQQPATGGLFGNTSTNTQTGGGLFGSTNANTTTQPATGGLFGNTSTNNNQPPSLSLNTGGLFGNTNTSNSTTNANPLFGNKAPGGLFGNTTTAPAPANNTGANPNPSNPLFSGGSGGLFGNTNTNTQPQQSTGGLFGSTNTQTQQPTGGLFSSNAQTQQPAGGLFGSANTQTQQPAGGLFGSTNNNQQQPTNGLFGSTNTQTSGGGLFGQLQQNQQPKSSLFGSTNALTTSSLNPPSNNTQGGGGLFGSSTLSSTNTLSSTTRGTGGEADAQTQFNTLQKRIEGVYGAWNAQSAECRFQHYFYNLVDPAQVNLYGRPPNTTNEALWQKAVRENPDRSCMVPVVAIGFDDLRQRVEAQSQQTVAHQEKLKELQTRIAALSERHTISNASRLSRASNTQTQITHRLLKLIQHLHLLIPALRSSAIRPEEEALRLRLEEIEEEVRRGRLRGKLNELWAVVGALGNGLRNGRDGNGTTEWAVVDEDGLAQIAQILTEQQAGLQHLTKILQRDLKDLGVIQGKGEEDDDGSDAFFGSTSTLRASALR